LEGAGAKIKAKLGVLRENRMSNVRNTTILQTVFPLEGVLSRSAAVVGFALFTALCAKVRISLPFTPVPITMQTFAVLLAGLLLGRGLGSASMALYLALGVTGLPLFSLGGGLSYLAGPTGGYLIGFLLAAYLVGYLAERGWDRGYGRCLAAMLAGELAIYLPGLLWLSRFTPPDALFKMGLWPFIPGDLVKIGLISVCLPSGWRLREHLMRRGDRS